MARDLHSYRRRPPRAPSRRSERASSARSSTRCSVVASGALAADGPVPKASACILLWLNGGPSHIDTFDPKPGRADGRALQGHQDARPRGPAERAPAATRRAGERARARPQHDRARRATTVARSTSCTPDTPRTRRSCTRRFGAWMGARLGDPEAELPAFVSIGGPSFGAGFLGRAERTVRPAEGGRAAADVSVSPGVDRARFERRLAALDRDGRAVRERDRRQQGGWAAPGLRQGRPPDADAEARGVRCLGRERCDTTRVRRQRFRSRLSRRAPTRRAWREVRRGGARRLGHAPEQLRADADARWRRSIPHSRRCSGISTRAASRVDARRVHGRVRAHARDQRQRRARSLARQRGAPSSRAGESAAASCTARPTTTARR